MDNISGPVYRLVDILKLHIQESFFFEGDAESIVSALIEREMIWEDARAAEKEILLVAQEVLKEAKTN